jgi:hypothetical protein
MGLTAAFAFLTVNLVLESLGWVVGAPRTAERFTMLVNGDVRQQLWRGAGRGAMMGVKLASRK